MNAFRKLTLALALTGFFLWAGCAPDNEGPVEKETGETPAPGTGDRIAEEILTPIERARAVGQRQEKRDADVEGKLTER